MDVIEELKYLGNSKKNIYFFLGGGGGGLGRGGGGGWGGQGRCNREVKFL